MAGSSGGTDDMTPRSFARIHVLLAEEAPLGVVIRRGPSKQVCTIGWDRRRDEFQLGQWLRARTWTRRVSFGRKTGSCLLGESGREGLRDEVQLFDFNPMTFERIVAPY